MGESPPRVAGGGFLDFPGLPLFTTSSHILPRPEIPEPNGYVGFVFRGVGLVYLDLWRSPRNLAPLDLDSLLSLYSGRALLISGLLLVNGQGALSLMGRGFTRLYLGNRGECYAPSIGNRGVLLIAPNRTEQIGSLIGQAGLGQRIWSETPSGPGCIINMKAPIMSPELKARDLITRKGRADSQKEVLQILNLIPEGETWVRDYWDRVLVDLVTEAPIEFEYIKEKKIIGL